MNCFIKAAMIPEPVKRVPLRFIFTFALILATISGAAEAQPRGPEKPDSNEAACEALLVNDLMRTMWEFIRLGFDLDAQHKSIAINHPKRKYPHAWARVVDDDLLMLGIYTRGPRGGRIHGFEGHRVFQFFLSYFGPNVKAILGNWEEGSDNLEAFNDLVRELPPKEAALRTWTGQQAYNSGFTQVKILDKRGPKGAYTNVVVEFKKPRNG